MDNGGFGQGNITVIKRSLIAAMLALGMGAPAMADTYDQRSYDAGYDDGLDDGRADICHQIDLYNSEAER
jgi:hypothetical protein